MSSFDDLRRDAERVLGKETVGRIEKEFRRERDSDRREIISTGNIDFKGGSSEGDSGRTNHGSQRTEAAEVPQETTPRAFSSPGLQAQTTPEVSHSATLLNQAVKWEYMYGMLGLVLGLVSIVGGSILGLHGVAGATSWTASVLGLKSQINDAAPGVVLFIVGIFLVWITKPKIRFGALRG